MNAPSTSEAPERAAAPAKTGAAPGGPRAAARHAERLGRLGRSSLIYAFANFMHKGTGLILLPLYTFLLGSDDYGALCLVLSVCAFLQVVLMLAMQGPVMRFYFDYRQDPEVLARFWGTLFTFGFLFALAVGTALCLFGEPLLRPLVHDVPFWPFVVLGVAAVVFQPTIDTFLAVLQTTDRAWSYCFTVLGQVALKILLVVVLVGALGQGLSGALWAGLLSAVPLFAVAVFAMRRRARLCLDRGHLRDALSYSLPLVPHATANQSRVLLDRVLLAHMISTAAVGTYYIGFQLAVVTQTLINSVNRAYTPMFMATMADGDQRQLDGIRDIGLMLVVAYCTVAAFLSLFAKEVVWLLASPEFQSAHRVVPMLAFGFAAWGLYSLFVVVLYYRKDMPKWVAAGSVTMLVASVALNVLLIPVLGMLGASLSALCVHVLMATLIGVVAHRFTRVQWDYGRFAAVYLLSAAVASWALWDEAPPTVSMVAWKLVAWAGLLGLLGAVAWGNPLVGWRKVRRALALMAAGPAGPAASAASVEHEHEVLA